MVKLYTDKTFIKFCEVYLLNKDFYRNISVLNSIERLNVKNTRIGTIVYDTDMKRYYVFDGIYNIKSNWLEITL